MVFYEHVSPSECHSFKYKIIAFAYKSILNANVKEKKYFFYYSKTRIVCPTIEMNEYENSDTYTDIRIAYKCMNKTMTKK